MKIRFVSIISTLVSASISVSACAIRPIPQNATKVSTYDIVQRIRCEMRDTLRAYLIGAFAKFGPPGLAAKYKANPALLRDFDARERKKLPRDLQDLLNRFDHGYVGYEFTFDITEHNTLGGGISIGELITRGMFSASVNGEADKQRKNTRNFIVIDNFEQLVRFLGRDSNNQEICSYEHGKTNFSYPISGSLNLDNSFRQFVNLYEFGSLNQKKESDSVWNDTMEFTTTFSGDAGGTVTLSAVAGATKIVGANAKYTAKRVDKHKLVLSFVLSREVSLLGKPLTASAINARGRALTRVELACQRVQNEPNVELILPCIPEKLIGADLLVY